MNRDEVSVAVQQGLASLRAGQAVAARDTFLRLVRLAPEFSDGHLGLAHAYRLLEEHDLALAAVTDALTRYPKHVGALILKGDLLHSMGHASAAAFYQAGLRCAAELEEVPYEWAGAVQHAQAMCAQYVQQYEDALRDGLRAVDPDVGPPSRRLLHCVDLLVGKRTFYPSVPLLFRLPELPTVQFFERELFPWLARLEAATEVIRAELMGILKAPESFGPYLQSDPTKPVLRKDALLDNLDWSACFLWKNGVRVASNADCCPQTEALLAELPLVKVSGRSPSILFSLMRPKSHIPAHHGFVNSRLIVHLPLIVPQGCRFRVGNETREWVEGQAWLFDDTIEHEAWNPSDQVRVVLLFEVWRPELSASERTYVTALFEAINRQRGAVGNWGI